MACPPDGEGIFPAVRRANESIPIAPPHLSPPGTEVGLILGAVIRFKLDRINLPQTIFFVTHQVSSNLLHCLNDCAANMTYVNGGSVIAVAILFIVLGISAVIARFNIRRQKSGLGIDDWLCLPALVNSQSVLQKGHPKANDFSGTRHRRGHHYDHR